jgi:predicted PolB exonuclease-like 3'-5' exonuclease
MIRLALDIETDAMPERIPELPEPEVAIGNLKDPDKIKEKIATAKRNQIARMALDPHFARVLAWAVVIKDEGHELGMSAHVRIPGPDQPTAERNALNALWGHLSGAEQLYTFNGAAFDLPFLYRRSLLLGVRPCAIEIDKYKVRNFAGSHVDLYQLLQHWEVGNGRDNPLGYAHNQAFYAKAILGITPPYPDLDKSRLGDLYADGDLDTIHQLVTWDAAATWKLAERLHAVYP